LGLTFVLQARFSERLAHDIGARAVLGVFVLIVLFHPNLGWAAAACLPVLLAIAWWYVKRGRGLAAAVA
jgi:hypothetical protein